MKIVPARFTRADYALLPEDFPAQLIDGFLVKEDSPTHGHQVFLSRLHAALVPLVGPDRAIPAPQDVGIDDWNVFQPDLLVLDRLPSMDVSDVGIPLLAIEILSPSTARRDRSVKRRRLIAAGVKEVWIVDPAAQTVEVHDAAGCRSTSGDTALASVALPGFEVVPSRLFAPPKR